MTGRNVGSKRGYQFIAYLLAQAIYDAYFHPLSRFPSPRFCSVTQLHTLYRDYVGDIRWTVDQHERLGPVIRLGPNTLSFNDGDARKVIYGTPSLPKCPTQFGSRRVRGLPPTILDTADDADHRRLRRAFGPAFSDGALASQEQIIQKHTNILIEQLSNTQSKTDVVKWTNLITFDIISELVFGKSFNQLSVGEMSRYTRATYSIVRFVAMSRILRSLALWMDLLAPLFLPHLLGDFLYLIDTSTAAAKEQFAKAQAAKTHDGVNQAQIWGSIVKADRKDSLSEGDITIHVSLFMGAGSETTSTALSGAIWLLGKDKEAFSKLRSELRGVFQTRDDITMRATAGLPYLNACVYETLRLYPPLPTGLTRTTRPEGTVILGQLIPGGVRDPKKIVISS